MKHRLLEYLVEKKGFTVFAIEGNWPEALVADRYINSGEGDAASSLAAMYFWTWQTQEVRAMLEWMRNYNAKRGDRSALSFSGFDMQYPRVAIKLVTGLFARIGGAGSETIQQCYAGMDKLQQTGADLSQANLSRLKDSAAKALDIVQSKREALVTVATAEEYQDALQAAHIIQQFIAARIAEVNSGLFGYAASRDQSMAENVRWLAEQKFPGQKIVLWAHNGHVGAASSEAFKSMGMRLRETYGDKMVVLGFASHSGEVRAISLLAGSGPVALKLAPAKPTSIEGLFADTGLPRAILDFRQISHDSALAKWLAEPRLHRSIGAGFYPDRPSNVYEEADLPRAYNGLIFIAQSTAAKPLN
jgi:erythromycin esterase